MARALTVFSVAALGIRLRVRVLPTVRDVDHEYREYREGRARRGGQWVHAYFRPARRPGAAHLGTVVLASNGRAEELVPHEVAHAVVHRFGLVERCDDERFATAVGLLCARIHRQLHRRLEINR